MFCNCPKVTLHLGYFWLEFFSPRTFKNRPICSHWYLPTLAVIREHTVTLWLCISHYLSLSLSLTVYLSNSLNQYLALYFSCVIFVLTFLSHSPRQCHSLTQAFVRINQETIIPFDTFASSFSKSTHSFKRSSLSLSPSHTLVTLSMDPFSRRRWRLYLSKW